MAACSFISTALLIGALIAVVSSAELPCRFALDFSCDDFLGASSAQRTEEYLNHVMKWEGHFAQPGVGYDAATGYTYDGHPLDYYTGELYGDPHGFSAPSKESIHVSILALAVSGNAHAQAFAGGLDKALELLSLKMKGYMTFNETYPGFGCWSTWVDFDTTAGTFNPLDSWSDPYYKTPGLDNGEWFWALYAAAGALEQLALKADESGEQTAAQYAELASLYRDFVNCQKASAKTIFYRGDGVVSSTVYILDASLTPAQAGAANYISAGGDPDKLNDPYEGETMTQLLYLFAEWESEAEREVLWLVKREHFQAANYTVSSTASAAAVAKAAIMDSHYDVKVKENESTVVTVQKGWWFSTHEQWKLMLLPYLSTDLPLVRKVFANAEKVSAPDAYYYILTTCGVSDFRELY